MRTSMTMKLVVSACVANGGAAALTASTADAGVASPPAAAFSYERSVATAPLSSPPPRDDRIAAYEEFTNELALMVGDESDEVPVIDGRENGFAGLSIDEERLGVDLYWVGDVAPSVVKFIEAHPEATVRVHAAEYTRAEMIATCNAVGDGYDGLSGENGEFFTASPDHRGRGLKIRIRASVSEVSHDQVIGAVAQLTDVPVTSVIIGENQRLIPFPAYEE